MFMRVVQFVCLLALLAGALLCQLEAAHAQGTQEQQQACTPDAMRLCADAMPDIAKITACMNAKHAQLSQACKTAMVGSANPPAHRQTVQRSVATRSASSATSHSPYGRPGPPR
jgi:uncharacterized membrane protein